MTVAVVRLRMTTAGEADAAEIVDTDGGNREVDGSAGEGPSADDTRNADDDPATGDERHVVTAFLRNAGDVLLIRRSDAVGTYQGQWGAVSGYAEGDPDAATRWEIDEEVGLADAVTFVRRGDPVAFTDDDLGVRWVVHPSLFDCDRRVVEPNEEIAETAWVSPTEILRRETVPELWTAYDHVRPRVETVETDIEHGSAWLSLRALDVLRDEAGRRATVEADGRDGWAAVVETAEVLLDARPSMIALANRVNRAMTEATEERTAAAVERAAHEGIERALAADRRAAETAVERVANETVLTLSRSGTIERALSGNVGTDGDGAEERDENGPARVVVAESRPAREGVGVAERLAAEGVDVTLVTDAATAHALAGGIGDRIDRVVVGADTVYPDGSVLNKTGTRGVAIAAANEGVPVDVVAAADKVATTATVEGEAGPPEAVYDGDADLTVENPTFDHTPAAFVTGVVTERGVLDSAAVERVAAEFRELAGWRD
jgi:translation initiation factor 2B subunit (eIF-2B alpha/beta/delta family)